MALRKNQNRERAPDTYHFERENLSYQLMAFASREISFRVNYMGETYEKIADRARSQADDVTLTGGTVARIHRLETKRPQVQTLFPLLQALGFEFDMVKQELAEVIPLRKQIK